MRSPFAALPILLFLAGCTRWEEHLTIQAQDRGGSRIHWSAFKRGLTGEGHLDKAGATWTCTPSADGASWTVAAPAQGWQGARLGPDPKSTWTGSVAVSGSTLVVDLVDASGKAFPGNGSYELLNAVSGYTVGRR
jgi:hypothetical protein